ncbi:MAG: hypothetical protein IKM55_01420 [Bacilli bacterium]|nr:hypothetical protein [Bacilli bacterium]
MKLPSVYANVVGKQINNNSNYYRSRDDVSVDLSNLKALFDRNGFGDRINVEIKTSDGVRLEKLVLCKNNYFVTIDNRKIYFDSILEYKIKK